MLQLLQLPVCSKDVANDPAATEPTIVVEQIRRMRGGAQSHLMRSKDNDYYVVKFQGNPQGTRILVNELLGTLLAARLGLPTTPVAICYVSEELIRLTPDLCFELARGRNPCQPGLQFGSLYPGDPRRVTAIDLLPTYQLPQVRNLSDFAGMLVFDQWTCNADGRQTIFYRADRHDPYEAVMIDQGLCFNGREWNFPDSPLRGLYCERSVYRQVRWPDDFEPWFIKLEKEINQSVLTELAKNIPAEWYDSNRDSLQQLLEHLDRRRCRARELVWALWKCLSLEVKDGAAGKQKTILRLAKETSAQVIPLGAEG